MSDELAPLAGDPAEETHPPRSREELWQRIRTTSRDEVVLAEMIRLGFWDEKSGRGKAPAKLVREIGKLEREVRELTRESAQLADRDRLLSRIRKRRLEEAKRRRRETRERREVERRERAEAWAERERREVLYLGEGVSAGLGHGRREGDAERLRGHGLPLLATAAELAQALGVGLAELRFLAFHRRVAETTHYRRFLIPKRTGGERLISAPMPRLKAAQRWILDQVLARVPPHEAAHGFVRERNIVTNARQHVGRDVVVNLDLQDFFPTLTYPRVKGLFRTLGYAEEVATVMALLTTEPEVDTIEMDGVVRYLHRGERHLPQGSPASPAITNLICRRLDRRLAGLADRLGFTYTRYADDLTFSAVGEAARRVGKLLRAVTGIVEHEDFRVHPQKTRVMRCGRRQEVTGLVVNDRVSVDRRARRRLRATLHRLEQDGPAGVDWYGVRGDSAPGHLLQVLVGYASFVRMVHPEAGDDALGRLRRVMDERRIAFPKPPAYPDKVPSWIKRPAEEAPQRSSDPWWKSWWRRLKPW